MIESEVIAARIRDNIDGVSVVEIRDLTGTKDHYEATVVATAFEAVSRVKQHQMVYGALGELMAGPVHALALKTYSPERWAKSEENS